MLYLRKFFKSKKLIESKSRLVIASRTIPALNMYREGKKIYEPVFR